MFFVWLFMLQFFYQEAPAKNKIPVVAKKGSVPAAKSKKFDSSSDSSSDDGFVEEEVSIEANDGLNQKFPYHLLIFHLLLNFDIGACSKNEGSSC